MNPLIRVHVRYEDGFEDEVRVRTKTIADALRIARDDDSYLDKGEPTEVRFIGYVKEDQA